VNAQCPQANSRPGAKPNKSRTRSSRNGPGFPISSTHVATEIRRPASARMPRRAENRSSKASCALSRSPAAGAAARATWDQSRISKTEQMAFVAEGAAQQQFGPSCPRQIVPTVANSGIDPSSRRHADERQHSHGRLVGHGRSFARHRTEVALVYINSRPAAEAGQAS
jgi:hypothetical protein